MQLNLMDLSSMPTQEKKRPRLVNQATAIEQPPAQIEMSLDQLLDEIEDLSWTDNRVIALMDGLIQNSLRSIRDKKFNTASFAEEVAWFFDCFNDDHPFSARNCAVVAGLDIDSIRMATIRALPMEKVRIILLIDNGSSLL